MSAQPSERPVRPEDFPRGYAETRQPGLLDIKAEQGSLKAQAILARKRRDGFGTLMFDLEYGQVFDAGLSDYREFFASLEYGWWLLHNGCSLDGVKGEVTVAARYMNGVQLKWRPL